MTPSLAFSATVSTAALVTPSSVRFWVSRPTMRLTALRAAGRSGLMARGRHWCSPAPDPSRPARLSAPEHLHRQPQPWAELCRAEADEAGERKVPTGRGESHHRPAQQLALRRLGHAGPQPLFQRRDGFAHQYDGVGGAMGVAEKGVSTKPPELLRRSSGRLLSVLHRFHKGAGCGARPSRGRPADSRPRWGRTSDNSPRGGAGRSAPSPPFGCRRGRG